jgi:hypothetical protein
LAASTQIILFVEKLKLSTTLFLEEQKIIYLAILVEGSIFRLLCWGVFHVPEILVMGQSKG